MKLSYRNGLLDGPCYTYTENGRLEFTTIWRNGSKVNEIKGGRIITLIKILMKMNSANDIAMTRR